MGKDSIDRIEDDLLPGIINTEGEKINFIEGEKVVVKGLTFEVVITEGSTLVLRRCNTAFILGGVDRVSYFNWDKYYSDPLQDIEAGMRFRFLKEEIK